MGKKRVECEVCLNIIDVDNDHYVILRTHRGEDIIEDLYFHYECWKYHFKQAVAKKVNSMQNQVVKGVRKMVGDAFGKR